MSLLTSGYPVSCRLSGLSRASCVETSLSVCASPCTIRWQMSDSVLEPAGQSGPGYRLISACRANGTAAAGEPSGRPSWAPAHGLRHPTIVSAAGENHGVGESPVSNFRRI